MRMGKAYTAKIIAIRDVLCSEYSSVFEYASFLNIPGF